MDQSALSRDLGPTLIGGASRSGKTFLSLALSDASGPVAGFPLEGVFHLYYRRRFLYFDAQRTRIIREYLNRPRYITGERNKTARPIDYMTQTIEALTDTAPRSINNQISLISWLLDQFCEGMERTSWAAFDLHPEFLYKTYRRFIPNLRLAVMQREPISAIAASLFWRTWPNPPPDRRQRYLLMLAHWHLSRIVSRALAEEYPGLVAQFSFDRLCSGDKDEHSKLAEFFSLPTNSIKKSFDFIPHFSFHPNRGFLGPDNTWKHVLDETELEEIRSLENGHVPDPFIRSLLALGVQAPVLTRQMIEGYLYPAKAARRRWNSFKQLIIDTQEGLRLRFLK